MKKLFFYIKIVIFICILNLPFYVGIAVVEGNSMKPKLNNNDIILYKKDIDDIERFDIVIINLNSDLLIKRVIGLPGEKVEYINNELYIDDAKVLEDFQKSVTKNFNVADIISDNIIPDEKLLVLGDNRLYSHDSRDFGLVDIEDIEGTMLLKLF